MKPRDGIPDTTQPIPNTTSCGPSGPSINYQVHATRARINRSKHLQGDGSCLKRKKKRKKKENKGEKKDILETNTMLVPLIL